MEAGMQNLNFRHRLRLILQAFLSNYWKTGMTYLGSLWIWSYHS